VDAPRFPESRHVKVEGGKLVLLVSTIHRPPLPPGNIPDSHFCYRLSRNQSHSAVRKIMSMKNFNDNIKPATCNAVPQPVALQSSLEYHVKQHKIRRMWKSEKENLMLQ
jgi:hypothetical protein